MTQVPAQFPIRYPAPIAFIGDAPSHVELDKGIPLVGPAGRIFNSLLRNANLDRDEFLITNVFSENLPDNEVKNWCAPMAEARAGGFTDIPPIGDAGFLRPEYRWHLTRLQKELEKCQPKVIVPLGGTALWAMTGTTNIGALRGTVAEATRLVPGAKMLPTYHPNFVMKHWKYYTVVVGDFEKARQEADYGREIKLPTRRLILAPTLMEIRDAIERFDKASIISVDIETGWGSITCIGFADGPEFGICIPFVDLRNSNRSYWPSTGEETTAWRYVRQILGSPIPKLGQNYAGYDMVWLLKKYHLPTRNVAHDTRLMHHALNPELPKSLEFMQGYASQGAWKHWGKHKQEKRDD